MNGSGLPSTRCAEAYTALDALPREAAALFARPADDVFTSEVWYRTVLAHALPPGATACFVLCRSGGEPALFPMQTLHDGRALTSLTTPYTCRYRPLPAAAPLGAFGEFARFCRAWPSVRLDALADDWPAAATRAAGLSLRRFAHFGNWYEGVADRSWAAYLATRPGPLRETIRRRLRRAERECRFELTADTVGLDAAIDAFETVYGRSWKQPEPFPDFNAALMRALAPFGVLRLGVLYRGNEPIAAQFWVVEHARATVLKLAHDEAHKPLSPGTVLTALMLRHLLDEEHVPEIDFGRGDDDYKRGWAASRRQRFGLILVNPWRPAGLAVLGRHALGRARAVLRRAG